MVQYLYIIDYWVPFPQSEYGGVISLIAETDSEAYELLTSEDQFPDSFNNRIMPNIQKAQKLELSNEYKSSIIDAFIT